MSACAGARPLAILCLLTDAGRWINLQLRSKDIQCLSPTPSGKWLKIRWHGSYIGIVIQSRATSMDITPAHGSRVLNRPIFSTSSPAPKPTTAAFTPPAVQPGRRPHPTLASPHVNRHQKIDNTGQYSLFRTRRCPAAHHRR